VGKFIVGERKLCYGNRDFVDHNFGQVNICVPSDDKFNFWCMKVVQMLSKLCKKILKSRVGTLYLSKTHNL